LQVSALVNRWRVQDLSNTHGVCYRDDADSLSDLKVEATFFGPDSGGGGKPVDAGLSFWEFALVIVDLARRGEKERLRRLLPPELVVPVDFFPASQEAGAADP
jgi:hypothetical protein